MRKYNGFTLVELLACIVVIALLSMIAIPSALNISANVKDKAYKTKIDIMEDNAINYGQSNFSNVRKGLNPLKGGNYTCKFTYDSKNKVSKVELRPQAMGYNESKTLENNEYWCFRLTLSELVDTNTLNWDETNRCESCTDSADKSNYDNVILNPKDDYIINSCYMYIYYKNTRVYSYFDVNTCNIKSDTPQNGQEYVSKK